MKVDVLLGLQWGDEGKGKIVDVLTPRYDIIARFQGGPNAGHSLEFNSNQPDGSVKTIKHVLHTIPSGIFHPDKLNVIGSGVVIDPVVFKKEIDALRKISQELVDRISKTLVISKRAHLILPTHRLLDAASEASKGKTKIGSTLKGIGPTYMDKTGRNGLRVGDILAANFNERYDFLTTKHKNMLAQYNFEYELAQFEKDWFEGIEALKSFPLIDSEHLINQKLQSNCSILAEGAQGTLLDIDFGTYPYVTSSNTICAGACQGLGLGPNRIGEVFGIFKAYCTRVGSGPFPTELQDATGASLQEYGNEFGATTGRPRRCGWLDLPALKYSIMINGVTQLFMTKVDVLDSFETIKIATAYEIDGEITDLMPYELTDNIKIIYQEFKGWQTRLQTIGSEQNFPPELKKYIAFIEEQVGVPITIVSVGPGRDATILR